MIIYGRNPVMEALRGRRAHTVGEVWATPGAARESWLERTRVRTATPEEIARRCGSGAHQGICAEVGGYPYVSADELQAVKTRAKAQLIRQLDSNNGMALQLASYQTLFGDWRQLFREVDEIDRVTSADVRRVASSLFVPTNRTVGAIESTLNDVDRALERLRSGTYRTCQVCHAPIDESVLIANPLLANCPTHPELA